jgi:signal transduction histidine kinase/CheY-like chemotaxis protein
MSVSDSRSPALPAATETGRVPARAWIWRSYLKTTLVPLLLVELVIIAVYIATSALSHRENVAYLRLMSKAEARGIATREAQNINEKLAAVAGLVRVLQTETARALDTPYTPPADILTSYAMSADGVYHTRRDTGNAAMFYSGISPIGARERDKAHRLGQVDRVLRAVKEANPAVVQAYVNTRDSLNRIYPYVNALEMFPAKLDITTYNFYYEADARHNPARGVTWTDAYLDPAGAGWIVSAIAPVYRGDVLEAVVGVDVTIETIIRQVLDLSIPWGGYGVLVSDSGTVIALPKAGEADWGLAELTTHDYQTAVTRDTLKPDDFNLFKRPRHKPVADLVSDSSAGASELDFGGAKLAAWGTVAGPGWKLLVVVPRENVFGVVDHLRQRADSIAMAMLAGLVVFYLVFFGWLYQRARSESRKLTAPLLDLNDTIRRIGQGQYHHPERSYEIAELDESGRVVARMARAMGETVDKLDEANRAKREFLSNVSHEIRTPLSAILGMAGEIAGTSLDDTQREHLETLRRSGAELVHVINSILEFTALEAGSKTLEPASFNLRQCLEELGQLYRAPAEDRGLQFAIRVSDDVPVRVMGDEFRLRQVLMSLVDNALKFTMRGSVVLDVHGLPGDAGWARLAFAVRDTGPGIPPEKLGVIFEAFAQADGSVARRFGGLGLGLTIADRLVRLMGGRIEVQSREGQGSTFSLTLDLARAIPEAREPAKPRAGLHAADHLPPALSAVQPRRLRVLLVEDNPVNRRLLCVMLERMGHEVTALSDGAEALEAHLPERFDLGLFDIQMPGMDGLELTKRIRERESAGGIPRMPVLAVTANAFLEDGGTWKLAGMDACLSKPFSPSALARAMDALTPSTPETVEAA